MTVAGSYCRYCGTKIEPNSRFCSNCGRPTALPAATPASGGGIGSSRAPKKTRSKKKIAVIVILVIIGIFGALIAIGLSLSSTRTTTTETAPGPVVNQTQQTEDRIARLLGNDPNRINDPQWRQVATDIIRTENMDNALLVIHSTTGWSAVVQDSDFLLIWIMLRLSCVFPFKLSS